MFVYMQNNHCRRVATQLQLINIIIIIIIWHESSFSTTLYVPPLT